MDHYLALEYPKEELRTGADLFFWRYCSPELFGIRGECTVMTCKRIKRENIESLRVGAEIHYSCPSVSLFEAVPHLSA